jgi:hypothetical protein
MLVNDYQLFIDLDGVLVDFDAGVRLAVGKDPAELHPRQMWPVLARTPGFYDRLSWISDGRELWNAVAHLEPTILTGLPMGKWAEPQKRSWCSRELGDEVPVITGLSRHKAELALAWLDENGLSERIPVLVDDRLSLAESWEAMGGRFILHLGAQSSISALQNLGFPLAEDADIRRQ